MPEEPFLNVEIWQTASLTASVNRSSSRHPLALTFTENLIYTPAATQQEYSRETQTSGELPVHIRAHGQTPDLKTSD